MDIKRLICRVAKDELDVGQLKHLSVKVDYRRSNGFAGHGRVGHSALRPSLMMWLHMWKHEVDPVTLAHTIAHEFGHNKGLRHRDMQGTRYMYATGWRERYAYALEFPIRKKEVKTLSREEKLTEQRSAAVAKAQKMVRKWETNVKRANTMLKKWRKRLKAAEKRTQVVVQSGHVPEVLAVAAAPSENV